MSKGLEALERLKMFPIYQEIKRMPQQFRDKKSINLDLSIIEKELKALEIIKEKIGETTITYNYGYLLTEEEYDLLKEVLL